MEKRREFVIVKNAAENDLAEILAYFESEGEAFRSKLNRDFFDRFNRLLTTGWALRLRPEYGIGVRVAKFKAWLVFFRLNEQSVIILRVLHGSAHPKRNLAKVSTN